MQTFLAYPDFFESAAVLDNRRLNKQAVECFQIMKVLVMDTKAWHNHPAVRMWRGDEATLYEYATAIAFEWESRGFARSISHGKTWDLWAVGGYSGTGSRPQWLGDPLFHEVHRGNLVRKDPVFYAPKFPESLPQSGYVWPVDKEGRLNPVDMRVPLTDAEIMSMAVLVS